jgi:hypothetical protein
MLASALIKVINKMVELSHQFDFETCHRLGHL